MNYIKEMEHALDVIFPSIKERKKFTVRKHLHSRPEEPVVHVIFHRYDLTGPWVSWVFSKEENLSIQDIKKRIEERRDETF